MDLDVCHNLKTTPLELGATWTCLLSTYYAADEQQGIFVENALYIRSGYTWHYAIFPMVLTSKSNEDKRLPYFSLLPISPPTSKPHPFKYLPI